MHPQLGIDTTITLLAAGVIFLLALCLGVWKYRQMATAENHLAHPYVDIAHRAALLYITNQFENPAAGTHLAMSAGFLAAQFF